MEDVVDVAAGEAALDEDEAELVDAGGSLADAEDVPAGEAALAADEVELVEAGGSLAAVEDVLAGEAVLAADEVELVDAGGSLGADVAALVVAAAVVLVAAVEDAEPVVLDVFAATVAPAALPTDELEPEPPWPQPANSAVPATLPNNEMTWRRCKTLIGPCANAARCASLYFIAKALRHAVPVSLCQGDFDLSNIVATCFGHT